MMTNFNRLTLSTPLITSCLTESTTRLEHTTTKKLVVGHKTYLGIRVRITFADRLKVHHGSTTRRIVNGGGDQKRV